MSLQMLASGFLSSGFLSSGFLSSGFLSMLRGFVTGMWEYLGLPFCQNGASQCFVVLARLDVWDKVVIDTHTTFVAKVLNLDFIDAVGECCYMQISLVL